MKITWKAKDGKNQYNFYGTMAEFKETFPHAVIIKKGGK